MPEPDVLSLQLQKSKIGSEDALSLKNTFMPFFEQAAEWKEKAQNIVIKSAEQREDMQLARTARINLKNIRLNVEKTRKELKEESLRKGKAIDGLANVVKFLIVPIEEHLQEQENFIVNQEIRRKGELAANRKEELLKYDVFETSYYNLEEMPVEQYEQLLENSKKTHAYKLEIERKAEAERIASEKAEAEERERVSKENEQLKKEAEERERLAGIERKKQEQILEAEKAKLEIEKKKREQIEAGVKAKQIEEERIQREERLRATEEKQRLEELEKKAKLAPDKKKLEQLAITLTGVELPELKEEKAKEILKKVTSLLNNATNLIKRECLNL